MEMPVHPLRDGSVLRVKEDTYDPPWFPPGSSVSVVADCRQGGVLVSGVLADGSVDEELCSWEEFNVEIAGPLPPA